MAFLNGSPRCPRGGVGGVIPPPAARRVDERAATQAVEVLTLLFGPPRDYAIRLWNGAVVGTAGSRFVLALNHPGALRGMLIPPTDLNLGEAYVRNDFDVEGDLEAAIAAMVRAATTPPCAIITTSATTSTPSGWTAAWSIPAPTSPQGRKSWTRRRRPSSSTCAVSCACNLASACWTSAAGGGCARPRSATGSGLWA